MTALPDAHGFAVVPSTLDETVAAVDVVRQLVDRLPARCLADLDPADAAVRSLAANVDAHTIPLPGEAFVTISSTRDRVKADNPPTTGRI